MAIPHLDPSSLPRQPTFDFLYWTAAIDGPGKGDRDYDGHDGRLRAALDAMKSMKTKLAKPLARLISTHADPNRRFPPHVEQLFEKIGAKHSLTRCEASKK